MKLHNRKQMICDWVFDGCIHYHIENVCKENERIYCDLGLKIDYGKIDNCVNCKHRQRENHYYG